MISSKSKNLLIYVLNQEIEHLTNILRFHELRDFSQTHDNFKHFEMTSSIKIELFELEQALKEVYNLK